MLAQSSQPFEPVSLQKNNEYQKRRSQLIENLPPNSILFLVRRPNDMEYFLPDKYFYYLCGTTDPKALCVLISSPNTAEHLFLPERNTYQEIWEGKRLYPGEEASRVTGFSAIQDFGKNNATLMAFLDSLTALKFEQVYYSAPKEKSQETPWDSILQNFIQSHPFETKEAYPLIAEQRLIKSEYEIEQLKKAIAITGEGLIETMRFAQPLHYEYELQAVIEYFFKKGGAKRPGFDSIVGSGPNSCILHYNNGRRQIVEGDLVVMDVGAEYLEYSADITRTIPISGKFTPRQKEIYQIVLEAQNKAIQSIKPGISFHMVDKVAREHIEQAGYGRYFMHGTSHWLGLNVHDVGSYRSILKAGMVLTVEPGIYIAEENIGIRIEDDILVTADGYLLLSGDAPREVEAIEALMAETSYLLVPSVSNTSK